MARKKLKILVAAALLFAQAGCAGSRVIFPVSPRDTDMFSLKTQDGWMLTVHHYRPRGVPRGKPPVILCHGLNHNYLYWDLSDKLSFADYLADHGYDVWSVSLRGSGLSSKTGWAQFLELNQPQLALFRFKQYDHRKFDWNCDDYILEDVPALLRFVREKTGKPDVTWIGHSMGGMAAYAYLGLELSPSIKNLVLIGVPGRIPRPPSALFESIEKRKFLARMSLFINTKNVSVLKALFRGRLKDPLDVLNHNPENIEPAALSRFNAHVVENTSPGVLRQMQQMVRNVDFCSADGKLNYTENLPKVKANLLCLAGKLDNLAPPSSVLLIHRLAGSSDKTYRLFGIANGYSADYGHNDLILGKNAPAEVYPYILAWLDSH